MYSYLDYSWHVAIHLITKEIKPTHKITKTEFKSPFASSSEVISASEKKPFPCTFVYLTLQRHGGTYEEVSNIQEGQLTSDSTILVPDGMLTDACLPHTFFYGFCTMYHRK